MRLALKASARARVAKRTGKQRRASPARRVSVAHAVMPDDLSGTTVFPSAQPVRANICPAQPQSYFEATRLSRSANPGDVRPVDFCRGCRIGAWAAATMAGARPDDPLICQKSSKPHPHGRGAIRWSEHSLAQFGGGCACDSGPLRTAIGEAVSCARLCAPKSDATDQCAARNAAGIVLRHATRIIPPLGPDKPAP
jgi:hypothetical protein